MSRIVTPVRLTELLGEFDRTPAWSGLADALRGLIAEGRLAHDTRLPSERDLAAALPISRTTVTRAYDRLREEGWIAARVGAGTWTRLPGGPRRSLDRLLTPRGSVLDPAATDSIDLTCAAAPAPPGVLAAYQHALNELPSLLTDHGYFPAGMPELTRRIADDFTARGLPTVPEQVMVTPGALAATSIVAHALLSPGDRVLVETPVYPNAPQALQRAGARLVTLPLATRDPAATRRAAASTRLAYVIADFQNPTGLLLTDPEREQLAGALAGGRGPRPVTLVDESHQRLRLDGDSMPLPMAAHVEQAGGRAITVGSASKTFWGGLRLGWLRAPADLVPRLTEARLALDLGSPVLEQLALTHLLADPEEVLAEQRSRMRRNRDALVSALGAQLPEWEFTVPAGGLALWCRLPTADSVPLAACAEEHGVTITPGPMFDPEDGYRSWVRLPWTRDPADLVEAVTRLTRCWGLVRERTNGRPRRDGRSEPVVVA